MKKCATCGKESSGATCPACGEASWMPAAAQSPAPVVGSGESPTHADDRVSRRRRSN